MFRHIKKLSDAAHLEIRWVKFFVMTLGHDLSGCTWMNTPYIWQIVSQIISCSALPYWSWEWGKLMSIMPFLHWIWYGLNLSYKCLCGVGRLNICNQMELATKLFLSDYRGFHLNIPILLQWWWIISQLWSNSLRKAYNGTVSAEYLIIMRKCNNFSWFSPLRFKRQKSTESPLDQVIC